MIPKDRVFDALGLCTLMAVRIDGDDLILETEDGRETFLPLTDYTKEALGRFDEPGYFIIKAVRKHNPYADQENS